LELPLRGSVGIGQCRHAAKSGHRLDQDFLPLAVELGGEQADPGRVTAGAGQRVHQSGSDHIVRKSEDRNCRGRLLCGANAEIPTGRNDIDPRFDQFRRKFRNQFNTLSVLMPIDREVLALDEAGPPKFFEHRDVLRCSTWTGEQAAKAIRPSGLLRTCGERPRGRRVAEHRDELAPFHAETRAFGLRHAQPAAEWPGKSLAAAPVLSPKR
jgi:hypothetical protein